MERTFSKSEIESAKSSGWKVVHENIIAGKVRSALMEKEGNPLEWLEEDQRIKRERYSLLSAKEKRMYRDFEKRYARGME